MNLSTFTGRLGRDAETRHTANGTAVASFPMAVDVGWGDNKRAMWIDCAIFGKRAESGLIPHLVKGKQIAVSGSIEDRQFEKRDGTQGFKIALSVDQLDLLGGGEGQQPQQRSQASIPTPPQSQRQPAPADDQFGADDIPF